MRKKHRFGIVFYKRFPAKLFVDEVVLGLLGLLLVLNEVDVPRTQILNTTGFMTRMFHTSIQSTPGIVAHWRTSMVRVLRIL